jgi:hypothetical protein
MKTWSELNCHWFPLAMPYIAGFNGSDENKYDVFIGRPSIFSNPYTHLKSGKTNARYIVDSKSEAMEKFEEMLLNDSNLMLKVKTELPNKILACHCYPFMCHGFILAKYANNI